jgi:tetratricopeptide (TPR) repeat protein
MRGMESAIGMLVSAVDSGFAEISYELHVQSDYLRQILEVLQAPLDTQSRELRRRAQEAYANGWIDEAQEDFERSRELNKYDFTVHQYLGNIAFFHREDFKAADQSYAAAAKYAAPKSDFDAALALLSRAAVSQAGEDVLGALEFAEQALSTSPDLPEAQYAVARYLAASGSTDEGRIRQLLLSSFRSRLALCLAAAGDGAFTARRSLVDGVVEEYRAYLRERFSTLRSAWSRACDSVQPITSLPHAQQALAASADGRSRLTLVEGIARRDTVVDLFDADLQLKNGFANLQSQLRQGVASARSRVQGEDSSRNQKASSAGSRTAGVLAPILVIVGLLGGCSAGFSSVDGSAGSLLNILFFPIVGGFLGFGLAKLIGTGIGTPTDRSSLIQQYAAIEQAVSSVSIG